MLQSHRFVNFISFCLILFFCGCAANETKLDYGIEPIFQARSKTIGTFVAIRGVVTTPPGVFESSLSDKGFAVQDMTGGIYISSKERLKLSPGNEVLITGNLKENYGFLTVLPVFVSFIISNDSIPVNVQDISTGDVGEKTEGIIVNVTGKISQIPINDLPYGFKFYIDDGSGRIQIFVNTQTGIDINSFTLGQKLSITGLSGQFNNEYEIIPRTLSDIRN